MVKSVIASPMPGERLQVLEKQANDLGEARKALDSATNIARGLWFTFLSLTAYLVVSVGSVSHRDLFLETPVKLPLLNVDLPLVTFFWVAPLMFLVVHAYLLLNLKFMADNAQHYFNEVEGAGLAGQARHKLYLQLSNFLILQMLIMRRERSWGIIGVGTSLVVVLSVLIVPILVLIFIQLQFLPYHSPMVTTVHRFAIALDMGLLLFLWPRIAGNPETPTIAALRHSVWALVFAIVLFSFFVATFPGEPGRERTSTKLSGVAEFLFHSPVHQVKGQRSRWFSDTLVLTDADFVSGSSELPAEVTKSLRGRNLAGAFLARTDLRGADFTGANLEGANFREAKLRGAQFGCPLVRVEHSVKSLSNCTNLDNAILDGADLREAHLRQASLKNASIQGVQLQQANLEGAQLQGSLVKDSDLTSVSLSSANLTSVKFENANLIGSDMELAKLGGTVFQRVSLRDSRLKGAQLEAPTLLDVNVHGLIAPQLDWTTTLAQNVYGSQEAFEVRAPSQGFNSIAANTQAPRGQDFAIAAAKTNEPATEANGALRAIEKSAVLSREIGDTESAIDRWQPRVRSLQRLLCNEKEPHIAVGLLGRLSTMRGADTDKLLSFGPDRRAFVQELLKPECVNAQSLKRSVCLLVTIWSGRSQTDLPDCN